MPDKSEKFTIENIASPGHTYRVDRAKYEAMQEALIGILPAEPPGLTVADAKTALLPHLSEELSPVGIRLDGGSRRYILILRPRA
jgi:hypothetical protein